PTLSRFLKFFPFFFYSCRPRRDLHSFPTRRSSDLTPGWRRRFRISCWIRPSTGFSFGRSRVRPRRASCAVGPTQRKVVGGRLSRSEEHTSELQSRGHLVCRLLLEKKNIS